MPVLVPVPEPAPSETKSDDPPTQALPERVAKPAEEQFISSLPTDTPTVEQEFPSVTQQRHEMVSIANPSGEMAEFAQALQEMSDASRPSEDVASVPEPCEEMTGSTQPPEKVTKVPEPSEEMDDLAQSPGAPTAPRRTQPKRKATGNGGKDPKVRRIHKDGQGPTVPTRIPFVKRRANPNKTV